MPYSMVGASTLGYDLARLPGGDRTAQVLRTALRCGPDDLARLAAHHPGPARAAWWHGAEAWTAGSGTMSEALPLAGDALTAAATGDHATTETLLRRLELAPLGNVQVLDRMVRHDLLGWTWVRSGDLAVQDPQASAAADVLADAAVLAFCPADHPGRRGLAAGYLAARLRLVEDSPSTGLPDVDAVLEAVAASGPAERRAWRAAVDATRPATAGWAPAMHDATWAVSLSERLWASTDAHLAAVVAFRAGGFTPRDAAYGVWNALSGTLQATVTADLLPAATRTRLLGVWAAVHGG
ncbi:MAG: hypothetical protein ACXVWZ_11575 [Nocardioides sp.]